MASCASLLIVDDDPATLIALPDLLTARLQDVMVDTCVSAMTGLERLRHTNYRVVVADLRMPQMDGLTLLRAVHQLREHTPVVMMSGETQWGLARRLVEAGAFAFVQKPLERTPLISAVCLAIQCSELRERMELGEHRLARLSALLRGASTHPPTGILGDATKRIKRGSTASVEKIKRIMAKVMHYQEVYRQDLVAVQEEARARAKTMLETLGE